jgi:hypothetical protein
VGLAAPQELPFDEDDLAPLVAVIDELAAAGKGWVNLLPQVEEGHEPPPRSFVVELFSARGDAVPKATWTPPEKAGQRAKIGIQHGSGPKAIKRLADADLPLPDRWMKEADHPRRGLVVNIPDGTDTTDVVWWLLAASHALSVVPLTGSWMAHVYRP